MAAALLFPPTAVAPRRVDPRLLAALATALATVRRAQALDDLGDIDLPPTAPTADDAQRLQTAAPLYLARELEAAGLLRTAELIAGLFASGAINQPLGPTAQLIADFWRARTQRLAAAEREQLYAQVFEAAGFDAKMRALAEALCVQLDDPPRASDVHARVAVQEAADDLAGALAPHLAGMAAFAVHDIVQALSQATHFLRDRLLQSAFGVQDLWGLIGAVGAALGAKPGAVREHVELAREGATLLGWIAQAAPDFSRFDPGSAQGRQVIAAAEAWRTAAAELAQP